MCVCVCTRYETLAVATEAESRQDPELPLKTGGEETDGEPPIKCPPFPFHGQWAPKLAMKCYLIGRMPGTEGRNRE